MSLNCGTRSPVQTRAAREVSCAELALAAPAVAATSELETEVVWLLTSPTSASPERLPWVVNLREGRLNGNPGDLVEVSGHRFRRFGQYVLHVAKESAGELTGTVTDCSSEVAEGEPFVAHPLAPRVIPSKGMKRLAQVGGDPGEWPEQRGSDLALLDPQTVVVARGADGLRVIDIAMVEQGEMAELAHIPASIDDAYNDVVSLNQRYIWAASRAKGVAIWDLEDRLHPRFLADSFPEQSPHDGHNLLVQGKVVYLAQAPTVGTGALTAFDVSDPVTPRQLWRFEPDVGHDVHDVNVLGEFVYVSSLRGGLYVLRVTGVSVAAVARATSVSAHNLSLLSGSRDVVEFLLSEERLGGSLVFGRLDVAAPDGLSLTPVHAARVERGDSKSKSPAFAASPHNSECQGFVCFVAHYQLGLQVFDLSSPISDPLSPVATFGTWQPTAAGELDWLSGASGVLLALPFVYVLDTQQGLYALRWIK